MRRDPLHFNFSRALFILCPIIVISLKASATCESGFTWTQTDDNVISFSNTSTGTTINTIYYWGFGDGAVSTDENPTHTYSTPGNYYVCLHIIDSSCSSYFCDSITVTGNVICNLSVVCYEFTHASCDTCADGAAHSFASGGTPPYTYAWDTNPVQTTSSATGLLPGDYTVCVTDSNGCSSCCTVTIDTPGCYVTVGCYEYIHASCDTCADGVAHSYASGGTEPYSYEWNTNPVQTTETATGLLPGEYTVCVTDSNGCSSCCTVTIDTPTCNVTVACYEYPPASCDTCADGGAHAFASGGTEPYSYVWDTNPVQTTQFATGLLPGTYTVCATDANGCSGCCTVVIDTPTCNVTVACYEYPPASCDTCADGGAHAFASGGTEPYSYVWDTNPVQTTQFATGLLPGTYTVCATDANGCSSCCTVTIDTPSCNVYVYCYEYIHASCDTCADGAAHAYPTGGTEPYSYVWDSNPEQTTSSATGLLPGTYTICVTDANGCSACCTTTIDTASCNVTVACYEYMHSSCDTCADGIAHSFASGGTEPYTYEWDTNPVQTTNTAADLLPGTYTVCATDAHGCSGCCTVIIESNSPECTAYFYLYPDSSIDHTYWAVNVSSGTGALTYLWSWGDGTYDSIAFPSHTYADAGFYTICLFIQDTAGCTDSLCHSYDLQKMTSDEAENTIVTVNVIPDVPTAVQNESVLRSLSVFPNPGHSTMTINYSLEITSNVLIDVYDVLGNHSLRLINGNEEAGDYHQSMDISKLANGIYILQIQAGAQILLQKIAVQN